MQDKVGEGENEVKALDLFCKAGGASMGLHRAGFEVTGVDIEPQPNYPFRFVQADWCDPMILRNFHEYDLIWASPPCQRYTPGAAKWGTSMNHPHLIPEVRTRLFNSAVPYVIENVASARRHLRYPIMLCGTQFGLGVFRHRLFETSFISITAQPHHQPHGGRIGDGKYHTVTGHAGGSSKRDGWKNGSTAEWRIAMGIDWMTGSELAEAIPPAYSEWIGRHLIGDIPMTADAAAQQSSGYPRF
jgi:DNA (cytosine-5)-methyltransferase 1